VLPDTAEDYGNVLTDGLGYCWSAYGLHRKYIALTGVIDFLRSDALCSKGLSRRPLESAKNESNQLSS
jgi:hypothetical protein